MIWRWKALCMAFQRTSFYLKFTIEITWSCLFNAIQRKTCNHLEMERKKRWDVCKRKIQFVSAFLKEITFQFCCILQLVLLTTLWLFQKKFVEFVFGTHTQTCIENYNELILINSNPVGKKMGKWCVSFSFDANVICGHDPKLKQ